MLCSVSDQVTKGRIAEETKASGPAALSGSRSAAEQGSGAVGCGYGNSGRIQQECVWKAVSASAYGDSYQLVSFRNLGDLRPVRP